MIKFEIGYKYLKVCHHKINGELTSTEAIEFENFYYETLLPIIQLKLKDIKEVSKK